MALDDVPLEDAGRDYYDRQFSGRVRNIRKYGSAPPPRKSRSGASGWAAGGGVVAVLVVIRIIIAVAVGVGTSSSSSYNNYNSYQTPTMPSNPPIDWNNNVQVEPRPWQIQPGDLPDFQQDERLFPPIPPVVFDPDPLPPPVVPGQDRLRPDKDD
ncbi:MAG TPA: hypothetical protein DDY78_29460 [Planctomycetales bacterium]|jgi:hypothetical protein|nr:hypothetical protein [Planctomycetales bacterium]